MTNNDSTAEPLREVAGTGRYAEQNQSAPEPAVTLTGAFHQPVVVSAKPDPDLDKAFKAITTARKVAAAAERDYQLVLGAALEAFVKKTWPGANRIYFYCDSDDLSGPPDISYIDADNADVLWTPDNPSDPLYVKLRTFTDRLDGPYDDACILDQVSYETYSFNVNTWLLDFQA
jgi:hypothetical protein